MRRPPVSACALLLLACLVCLSGQRGAHAQGGGDGGPYPVRQGGKWGYVDRSGRVVIPAQFDEAWDFHDGLAHVKRGDRRAVIDREGRAVFDLQQVDMVGHFSDGLAAASTASRPPLMGFIDRKGRIRINPQYSSMRAFSEGLAVVALNRKYGYIDAAGNYIWKPTN